jgi:hypothetical protein
MTVNIHFYKITFFFFAALPSTKEAKSCFSIATKYQKPIQQNKTFG